MECLLAQGVSLLLSENQACRVSIRIVVYVTFPRVVSFAIQQRLTLDGAFEDTTLPASMLTDDAEKWGVMPEEGPDDLRKYDGVFKENARGSGGPRRSR